ncbi:hypothetical protein Pla163_10510 [Planctomycetes bacterium Pla163]|uniref:Right handed beta helix domain-containing protein n=1 Tax=Rohdeia mirabilis TaxID=2528008 RepID=A0A518CXK1_9BACT|nr:hypothetical protein Pla163_10510 [Planctomycetes bacterium Pla163]
MVASTRLAFALFLACVAPTVASAQTVWTVEPGGALDQIQAAVDLAADGDVILVRPGEYATFDVVGKSLVIQADPHASVLHFVLPPLIGTPDFALDVRDIAAGQSLVIRGLDITLSYREPVPACSITNCVGGVRFEDCTFTASNGDGVAVGGCASVTFTRCTLASDAPFLPNSSTVYEPNAGLQVDHSTIHLFDCAVLGSHGHDAFGFFDTQTSDGGPGIDVQDAFVFASGSAIEGGAGGGAGEFAVASCFVLSDGGPGAVVGGPAGTSRVFLFDTEVSGGAGAVPEPGCTEPAGSPGPDRIVQSGVVLDPAGERRTFGMSSPAREGDFIESVYFGEPGDLVFLLVSGGGAPGVFVEPFLAVTHLDPPSLVITPRGSLDGTGLLVQDLVAPRLVPGAQALGVTAQALFVDPLGGLFLSGPTHVVLLDAAL